MSQPVTSAAELQKVFPGAKPNRRYNWIMEIPHDPRDPMSAMADIIPSAEEINDRTRQRKRAATPIVVEGNDQHPGFTLPGDGSSVDTNYALRKRDKEEIASRFDEDPYWLLSEIKKVGGLGIPKMTDAPSAPNGAVSQRIGVAPGQTRPPQAAKPATAPRPPAPQQVQRQQSATPAPVMQAAPQRPPAPQQTPLPPVIETEAQFFASRDAQPVMGYFHVIGEHDCGYKLEVVRAKAGSLPRYPKQFITAPFVLHIPHIGKTVAARLMTTLNVGPMDVYVLETLKAPPRAAEPEPEPEPEPESPFTDPFSEQQWQGQEPDNGLYDMADGIGDNMRRPIGRAG